MPEGESDSGYKYWAFISYSHADKVWGDWLHRALETYRVPKRLVGTVSLTGERVPARVYPIFRDREELPVSTSLPENINHALEQSRCLIVVCSPRSAASRWVNEEIKTFKRLGKEGRVLALIVAGEPNASEDGSKPGFRAEDECFPQALRYRWGGDGELSGERTEPVAADARPDKDGKRHAKLKLLAGLLQVNYDQLRQREHERRARQLDCLVAATLGLLTIFAGIAVYSELQRRRADQATVIAQEQRQIAEAQRQEAQNQEREANTQRANAQQRAADAILANRKLTAQLHEASLSDFATARDLLKKGNWPQAIAYAGRALKYEPGNLPAASWLSSALVYGQGARNPPPRHLLEQFVDATCAAFSPDGKRIVTGCGATRKAGYTRQWNSVTGEPVGPLIDSGGIVTSASYSPDGKRIVTACRSDVSFSYGYAQQWDAATGEPIGGKLEHRSDVHSAVYSPDGKRILTASDDGTVCQWDAATAKVIGKPISLKVAFTGAAYSPDGKRFVAVSGDGSVRQWDAASLKEVGQAVAGTQVTFQSVVYSPDGQRILVTSGDQLTSKNVALEVDAQSGAVVGKPMQHDKIIRTAAYSPDGVLIVTASDDGTMRQWVAGTGEPFGEPYQHNKGVNSAVYAPDGHSLLSACSDGFVREWERTSVGSTLGEPLCFDRRFLSACYSPDGNRVLTAGPGTYVQQWDSRTGQEVGQTMAVEGEIVHAAYHPDGRRAITISFNGNSGAHFARQWDIETGRPIGEQMQCESTLTCAAYSPDGQQILTSSLDKHLQRWDAANGKPIGEPLTGKDSFSWVAYSPDGRRVVTSSIREDPASISGKIEQWDAATLQPIGRPILHPHAVFEAAYRPDGKRMVTACGDGQVRQWDADTGKPVGVPMPHGDPVVTATYSPDGRRILAGCMGDETRGFSQEWDVDTALPLGVPLYQGLEVRDARYRPDGLRIITAGYDGRVREWDCDRPLQPPPEWFESFVQNASGLRFDQFGELRAIPERERMEDQAKFVDGLLALESPQDPRWLGLARWFYGDVRTRKFSPMSSRTVKEVAVREMNSDGRDSALAAYSLAPDLPLVHIALASETNNEARASSLIRYDLARLSGDESDRRRAAAMLRGQREIQTALEVLEAARSTAAPAPSSALLADLVLTRWLRGDKDGAVRDAQRLIAADAAYSDPDKAPGTTGKVNNDTLALREAIIETLRRHPELAPVPRR